MPRYEVELEISAVVWVDVEADNAADAIDAAKDSYHVGDAQWFEVTDASTKEYAE